MYNKEIELVKNLAQKHSNDFDIYVAKGKSFSVSINQQNVDQFKYEDSKGLGLRIMIDNKVGYANTEDFSDEALDVLVTEAVANCGIIENEQKIVFENHADVKFDQCLYDPAIDEVSVEDKITLAKKTEKVIMEKDERVFNVNYCVYGDGSHVTRIVNSKGLDKQHRENSAYLYAGVLVKEDEEVRNAFDFQVTRKFDTFDPQIIAENAVSKAVSLLGGKPIETKSYPVIFDQDAMAQLLGVYCGTFNAKSVQEGKSGFAGKLKEKVGNELINIYDDGRLLDGYSTAPFDSEGFATQKTIIIENGVLKSFLHNTETAAKDGVKSTGNASRGYKSTVSISPTNFFLEPGKDSHDALFTGIDVAIEIVDLQGLHSGTNTISGDFSLSAEGFVWKNGKRESSLQQFTVAGNFYQMLNEIDMIANNLKFSTSAIGTPSVRIKSLAISG